MATVTAAPGVVFKVVVDAADADDPVSAQLLRGRFTVPDLLDFLLRAVPRGGKVLDLGAHVGAFSLAAAAAGYEVAAVEASPKNAALLRASIEANGFPNLQLHNIAVSDREGTLRFHSLGPYGHVTPNGDGEISIAAIPVDALMPRLRWQRADFVKLDIEGSEVAAIRGMGGLLAQDPPVLWCESNGHMLHLFGETPQSLKAALEAAGMQVYLKSGNQFVQVAAADIQGATVVDYVAARQLPESFRSRGGDARDSTGEQLAALRASATSSNVLERLYAARALRAAPIALVKEPESQRLRDQLAADPSGEVREVASAIPQFAGKKRPWWPF